MARPDCIARLHEAKYEWNFCDPLEKSARRKAYLEALDHASKELGLSGPDIEAAVLNDFAAWRRQESLPKTSQK